MRSAGGCAGYWGLSRPPAGARRTASRDERWGWGRAGGEVVLLFLGPRAVVIFPLLSSLSHSLARWWLGRRQSQGGTAKGGGRRRTLELRTVATRCRGGLQRRRRAAREARGWEGGGALHELAWTARCTAGEARGRIATTPEVDSRPCACDFCWGLGLARLRAKG
jgi:hypothetical protein